MQLVNSKSALLFILITICLDSVGLGIIIPSFPTLVSETSGVSIAESSKYYGLVLGSYAFMQFIFSPLIGNLSDRFGRRPILLISMLGMGLDYVVMYFAPNLVWLVVGRAISGIFGASYTTAAAYIADISLPENRAKNFGLVGAAFGIGFVIGPAIGGLLSDFGPRAPFLVASFCSFANVIYGFFVLKESLPSNDRRAFEIKRANPLGAILQMKRYKKLKYLFLVIFLLILTNMSVHSTWNYYTMTKFGWTGKDVGISLAVIGVCFGLVQGALSGFVVKKIGEKGAASVGLIILTITLVGIAAIPSDNGWLMYVFVFPYAFSGIIEPSVRSIVSTQAKNNEQGELQGVFTSMMSLGEIIGPQFFMWIYYTSVQSYPSSSWSYGMPFIVAAFLSIIAFIIVRWTLKHNVVQTNFSEHES
jgi:DHA1 family tetracycline resistance protein-like MFS transporter